MTDQSSRDNARRTALGAFVAACCAAIAATGVYVVREARKQPGAAGNSKAVSGAARAAGTGARATPAEIDKAITAARVYVKKGEPAKAETILRALLARAANEQDAHIGLAEALLAQNRPGEALGEYESALALGPETADLAFAAGTTASMAAKAEDAERWYRKSQSLEPGNPKHPLYLAQVQRRLGKVEDAKISLLLAARIDPELAVAWGALADIALEENNLSIAKGHIARARRAEPEAAMWRLLEARILRRDNEPEAAARLLLAVGDERLAGERALMDELAINYGMLGRPGDAASLYVAASGKKRDDPELAASAAEWLERAGRRDDAEVFASAAARMGSEKGKQTLQRLRAAAATP